MIENLKFELKKLFLPKYIYLRKFPITRGDIVIDLGANVGEVTDYFLRRGAKVYAYEPNPHAFAFLKKRFKNEPNVTLVEAAVSSYEGRSKLWLHEHHENSEIEFSQGASLQSGKSNVSEDYVEVVVTNIADILSAHEAIKLIKIDIEGGEYDIFDTILAHAEKIDFILLETHGEKHSAFQQQEESLQKKIKLSPYRNKIYTDWF